MGKSDKAEEKSLEFPEITKYLDKISDDEYIEFTKALTGLASCDVERGTEKSWLKKEERLEKLQRVFELIEDGYKQLEEENPKITKNDLIGGFRIKQKTTSKKANLSIMRYKIVSRLIRRINEYTDI